MMKIALPVLLAGIIMIAGIFAFIPIDKATTVHTTIQGTQLNNVASNFNLDLKTNSTATCSGSADFLVYYIFTNASFFGEFPGEGASTLTRLGIDDPTDGSTSTDIIVTLILGNTTSVSGIIGGSSGETITFFGNSTGMTSGESLFEDVGDLALTVVCQSGQEPAVSAG